MTSKLTTRSATTLARATKPAGDISSVFPSLSGRPVETLPPRFQALKTQLIKGREAQITESWFRLLDALKTEIKNIKATGSSIIPSISYEDVKNRSTSQAQLDDIRHRGVAIVRGVIPSSVALDYKAAARRYIEANKSQVRAFPKDNPAVYELYWTPSQVQARSHPNMLATQSFLNQLWHSSNPESQISTRYPVTYADRLRIRNPGDGKFALGPHTDGGSLERWEDQEYRSNYAAILNGRWEEYDPFDAKHRLDANQDLYNGSGACAMLRCFQGWLSMSSTGPGEGTLKVYPLLKHATAYFILRPFMTTSSIYAQDSAFPGSVQGAAQEFNGKTHPDLCLDEAMTSIPRVEPGDYVAWHCDAIHSVDQQHAGKSDSSVMYIPACPLTPKNALHLVDQRNAALSFSPPPDMPGAGGVGEAEFAERLEWSSLSSQGQLAMGMGGGAWQQAADMSQGERAAVSSANAACFQEK